MTVPHLLKTASKMLFLNHIERCKEHGWYLATAKIRKCEEVKNKIYFWCVLQGKLWKQKLMKLPWG